MVSQKISLIPGIYAASLTFFQPNGELDLETLRKHSARLAKSGLSGIVALGSNGEAAHLDAREKKLVTRTIRETLNANGYSYLPVVVGSSAQSLRETIQLCHDAASSGGSHALVLPPCYYKAAMSTEAIYDFYMRVADASPLPIVIYSFPAVTSDIVLSSDLIIKISQHPNVVGTKFTCGDTGKLRRVSRAMAATSNQIDAYFAVGGLADFILQSMVAGGCGAIAGGANLTPKVCVKVYRLFKEGNLEGAMQLQSLLSEGDWIHTAAGVGATKALLERFYGYGGPPRLPLQPPGTEKTDALAKDMTALVEFENTLQ